MSIKITYREEDRPIHRVTVTSAINGSHRTVKAASCGEVIDIQIMADMVAISKQDAAEFGAALIELAKQS